MGAVSRVGVSTLPPRRAREPALSGHHGTVPTGLSAQVGVFPQRGASHCSTWGSLMSIVIYALCLFHVLNVLVSPGQGLWMTFPREKSFSHPEQRAGGRGPTGWGFLCFPASALRLAPLPLFPSSPGVYGLTLGRLFNVYAKF